MRRLLTIASLMTILLASPAPPVVSPATAQYAPSGAPGAGSTVEQERERARSRFRYLMLGYGVIWVSLGFVLFDLNRKVAQVGKDIDELKGRLDMVQGPRGR